ncbi:MAG TPA: hypothetical protein VFY91_00685 [Microbacterium sp.]|nr:hypothetical protein [Microbacterium sp.]
MEETPVPPNVEDELMRLRARAYGTAPDIHDDPSALARLAELESERRGDRTGGPTVDAREPAHDSSLDDARTAPAGGSPGGSEPIPQTAPADASGEGRPAPQGPARLWVAAAVGAALVAAVYGGVWLLGPRPDASLGPTAREVEAELTTSLALNRRWAEDLDFSTLESYETYRGIEPWSAVDYYGDPCLVLVDRVTSALLEVACAPAGADLVADVEAWPALDPDFAEGLPDGSVIRFQLRDAAVDAFVHRAPTQ